MEIVAQNGHAVTRLSDEAKERLKQLVEEGTPENSLRAIRADTRYIQAWLEVAHGAEFRLPVPVELVADFVGQHTVELPNDIDLELVDLGVKKSLGLPKLSSLKRKISTLSTLHSSKGLAMTENPCQHPQIKMMLKKATSRANQNGEGRPEKKKPVSPEMLEQMFVECSAPIDYRDRALLYSCFYSGGRRRSEIVGLDVEHLTPSDNGWIYNLTRSKTNQVGVDDFKGIFDIAAEYLREWLELSGIVKGAVFRSFDINGNLQNKRLYPQAVAEIVKKRIKLLGLNPDDYAAHSIRSGFSTAASKKAGRANTMAATSHTSVQVFEGYCAADEVSQNPAFRLSRKSS